MCEPSAEDLVFENILAAKDENHKMMFATIAVLFFFSVGKFDHSCILFKIRLSAMRFFM